ncbi:MAG: OsmC family peroxiredoxin [Gemmatimonadaceae bacterium]
MRAGKATSSQARAPRLGSGAFEGKYCSGRASSRARERILEELLGAAYAGCFTMALAAGLARAGHTATRVDTTATVHLDKVNDAFTVTGIDLVTHGIVPGISAAEFERFAEDTKKNCIISRALVAVLMTVKATLG